MKKTCFLLAVMVCYILGTLTAKADVLIEPMDSFYEEHSSACTYVGRSFIANGPDGKVILYKSPQLPEVVDTWENGREVYIQFSYEDKDGVLWGIYEDYAGTTGWMPMDYMDLVYDSISFQEEYADQIRDEIGSLDEKYQDEELMLWKYPGSAEYQSIQASDYLPDYRFVYEDENGKLWGRVGYYFGIRDVWLYLEEPTASYSQIYPGGGPQREGQKQESREEDLTSQRGEAEKASRESTEAQDTRKETDRIVPKPDYGIVVITIALVLLVVGATGGLLLFFRKKGRRD